MHVRCPCGNQIREVDLELLLLTPTRTPPGWAHLCSTRTEQAEGAVVLGEAGERMDGTGSLGASKLGGLRGADGKHGES